MLLCRLGASLLGNILAVKELKEKDFLELIMDVVSKTKIFNAA